MDAGTKGGSSEAVPFVDDVTGQKVLQLTNSAEHSVHAYYDTPPWCPSSGRLAFSRRRPGATGGDIVVMDADGNNLARLAHSRVMTPNHGAMAQWSPDGRRVYFRDRDGHEPLVGWVDVNTGKTGSYPGILRMVRPVGNEQAYYSDRRYLSDEKVVAGRDTHGVFVQDLASGTSRRLASVSDCLEIHPRRAEIANWHLYVRDVKWSPTGDRVLFIFTNAIFYPSKFAELPVVRDVYVINVDGGGLRHIGELGGHPSWHPNGRDILSISPFENRPGKSLILTNADTGERRLATDLISADRSHPSYSPDGAWILVDYVLPNEGSGSINAVHADSRTVRHLVQTTTTDHSHRGTHLHPVWSRDGRQILYASDASGTAQLCVITLEDQQVTKGV